MLTKYVFKMVVLSKIVYSVQQMDLVNKNLDPRNMEGVSAVELSHIENPTILD